MTSKRLQHCIPVIEGRFVAGVWPAPITALLQCSVNSQRKFGRVASGTAIMGRFRSRCAGFMRDAINASALSFGARPSEGKSVMSNARKAFIVLVSYLCLMAPL